MQSEGKTAKKRAKRLKKKKNAKNKGKMPKVDPSVEKSETEESEEDEGESLNVDEKSKDDETLACNESKTEVITEIISDSDCLGKTADVEDSKTDSQETTKEGEKVSDDSDENVK